MAELTPMMKQYLEIKRNNIYALFGSSANSIAG